VRSSQAVGTAPWCAVISLGMGEPYWDCQYRSIEECAPVVVAGNRGFCNPNPGWEEPANRAPRKKRRVQHD